MIFGPRTTASLFLLVALGSHAGLACASTVPGPEVTDARAPTESSVAIELPAFAATTLTVPPPDRSPVALLGENDPDLTPLIQMTRDEAVAWAHERGYVAELRHVSNDRVDVGLGTLILWLDDDQIVVRATPG